MFRVDYHPKAFLALKKNIRPGLISRTRILSILENQTASAKMMARETGLRYAAVLHHLRLLEAEGILIRRGDKPYSWELTGMGQRRLTNST
jgi:DNA-binding transcriptional ArsR family regulator